MVDRFNKPYYYSKGVFEVKVFNYKTRELEYYSNKVADNNLQSSVNLNELTAGIGNATVIALPDTAKINLTLSTANVGLKSRHLQVGGELGYNGIYDTCELIESATAATLKVSRTPVAPYGSTMVCCYINGGGTPYELDPTTGEVKGFVAEVGKRYAIRYYTTGPNVEELTIHSLFEPGIKTVEVKMPIYTASEGAAPSTGTLYGYWMYIIPRFMFGGDISLNQNNTTYGQNSLNGQAITYDPEDMVTCDLTQTPVLAYMVWQPLDETAGIKEMAVLNGAMLSLTVGGTAMVPVKYVMEDGLLAQPDFTKLTFASAAEATATVSAAGLVTGVAAGDTEVTVTDAANNLKAVCNVSVAAAP